MTERQQYGSPMRICRKTTLYLPEELHVRLKVMAARRRVSMTTLLIDAVHEKLSQLEKDDGRPQKSHVA